MSSLTCWSYIYHRSQSALHKRHGTPVLLIVPSSVTLLLMQNFLVPSRPSTASATYSQLSSHFRASERRWTKCRVDSCCSSRATSLDTNDRLCIRHLELPQYLSSGVMIFLIRHWLYLVHLEQCLPHGQYFIHT